MILVLLMFLTKPIEDDTHVRPCFHQDRKYDFLLQAVTPTQRRLKPFC